MASPLDVRLLVDVDEQRGRAASDTLTLNGRSWQVRQFSLTTDAASHPAFVCVSYVWGNGRVPNSLFSEQLMSDRTLDSLQAAMRASTAVAFWIDAFCVPAANPDKSLCLESLGYIFSAASAVMAVLSAAKSPALDQMRVLDSLEEQTLLDFDQDEWIRSVWTYQEVVNSQQLFFVSRDRSCDAKIDGSHFLNCIGYSLHKYKQAHSLDSFAVRAMLPSLDAFEDLVADWMISDYGERSALQVMSNLDRRVVAEPRNYYYSLLGSICKEPSRRPAGSEIARLSAKVMQTCEDKNDYSFVYCPMARNVEPGNQWRPRPDAMRSILPWHGFGSAQPGRKGNEGHWLQRVVIADTTTSFSTDAMAGLVDWLRRSNQEPQGSDLSAWSQAEIVNLMFQCLVFMGFTGSREAVLLADGFFLPQWPVGNRTGLQVLVATEVYWTFGSPGLARQLSADDRVYVPGVFVGKLTKSRAQDVLL